MACDELDALRRRIDVLERLKERAEAERDKFKQCWIEVTESLSEEVQEHAAVKGELELVLAVRQQHRERIRKEIELRNEARQLVVDVAAQLDPRLGDNAVVMRWISAAQRRWAEEKTKKLGG